MLTYEQQRDANIAANNVVLESLGLAATKTREPSTTQPRKRKQQPSLRQEPVRKSSRSTPTSSSNGTSAASQSSLEKVADVAKWQDDVFREVEASSTTSASSVKWDAKKHHQHLTRSPGGRAIATTGVAGYGAALACCAPSHRWAVRAVRFGVGGFGGLHLSLVISRRLSLASSPSQHAPMPLRTSSS